VSDPIHHPAHYNMGKIQPDTFIADQKLNFRRGCVVKYVSRAEHKGTELQDLEKAAWYLNKEIEDLRNPPDSEIRTGECASCGRDSFVTSVLSVSATEPVLMCAECKRIAQQEKRPVAIERVATEEEPDHSGLLANCTTCGKHALVILFLRAATTQSMLMCAECIAKDPAP